MDKRHEQAFHIKETTLVNGCAKMLNFIRNITIRQQFILPRFIKLTNLTILNIVEDVEQW